jgi:hypothetical protein
MRKYHSALKLVYIIAKLIECILVIHTNIVNDATFIQYVLINDDSYRRILLSKLRPRTFTAINFTTIAHLMSYI